MGLVSIIGNSIVLAAILRTRQLHTITNVFVGNLAIADIAVGVLVAPLAALSFEGLPRHFYGCVAVNSLILLFTNVSIFMLLAVALERFLAIKEPFTYQRVMTVRRAIFINMVVWLIGVVFGLVPMYGWNSGNRELDSCQFTAVISYQYMVYFQFFGLVLVPLSLMLAIYIYILIIVRRHTRQTNALHRQFQHNNPTTRSRRRNSDAAEDRNFNKDVRAAKMFALVIFLFGLFWLPVNVFNCVSLFCGQRCEFAYEALLVAIVMSHANSCINPLVYAASNSRIKRAIKMLFGQHNSIDDLSTDINVQGRSNNDSVYNRENIMKEFPLSAAGKRNTDRNEPASLRRSQIFTVHQSLSPGDEDLQSNGGGGLSRSAVHYASDIDIYPSPDSPDSHHDANIRDTVTSTETNHLNKNLPDPSSNGSFQIDSKIIYLRRSLSSPQSSPRSTCSNGKSKLPSLPTTLMTENLLVHVSSHSTEPPSAQTPQSSFRVRRNTLPNLREQITQQSESQGFFHINANPLLKESRPRSPEPENSEDPQTHINFAFVSGSETNVDRNSFKGSIQSHENLFISNVSRTPEPSVSYMPVRFTDQTPTEVDCEISFRPNLKSPSLFSEMEEHSLAKNKRTEHTKL